MRICILKVAFTPPSALSRYILSIEVSGFSVLLSRMQLERDVYKQNMSFLR